MADRVEFEHIPLLHGFPNPLIVVVEEEEVPAEKLFSPFSEEAIRTLIDQPIRPPPTVPTSY